MDVLTEWRLDHPEVTLNPLLPYHPYDQLTPTLSGFDGTF